MVKFIAIENSYTENARYRYDNISVKAYVDYLNAVPQTYSRFESDGTTKELLTKNCTFFEVLEHSNKLKFYFDIENVTDENTIYDIITKFKEFMKLSYNVEFTDYVLTLNSNSSHHAGYSYHLIFNHYCNQMYYMSNIVARFIDYAKNKGVNWINCIDTSVYSKVRLFRSINQVGITKVGGKAPENDKHVLIVGEVRDSIIQDIDKCKNLCIKELGYRLKSSKLVDSTQSSNFKDVITETVKQTIKQLIDNRVIFNETQSLDSLNPITKPVEANTNDIKVKSVTLHKPNMFFKVKSTKSTVKPLPQLNLGSIPLLKPLEPIKNQLSNSTNSNTTGISSIPKLKPLPNYSSVVKSNSMELNYDDKLFSRIFMLVINEKLYGMKLKFANELVEYYKSHQSFSGYSMKPSVISDIINKFEVELDY